MVQGKDITIGIDGSGILSSVGPRARIGIVSFALEDLGKLHKEGIRGKEHFRRLRNIQQQQQIRSIIERNAVWCESVPIEHNMMDDYKKRNMGRHVAECLIVQDVAIYVAEQLSERGFHVKRIVIDKMKKTLKPPQYYFDEKAKEAIEKVSGAEVIVAEEADKAFIECTAAWIVAYVAFKIEEIAIKCRFGRIGSGHPADKQTETWLKEYYAGHRSFDNIPHQAEAARIKQFSRRTYHVLDVRWRTPYDQRDIGRGLSAPCIVLKDAVGDPMGENLEYVSLRRNLELDISIYERRCPGVWLNTSYEPCSYTDLNGINGWELADGEEKCSNCAGKTPPMECIFNPRCDGYQALCRFEDFGAEFCGNLHANYLICFKNVVKVGQAFYYNLGRRLLEQGPAHALIYSITPNRQMARDIEKTTASVCKKNRKSLRRMGVLSVRQKSPESEHVLRYFYENWNGSGEMERLHNVLSSFRSTLNTLETKECLLDEPMEMDLTGDYKEPYFRTFESRDFRQLRGKVIGFRGHYFYLKSNTKIFAVDMSHIRYRIIKGGIAYGYTE